MDALGKSPDEIDPLYLFDYEWGRTLYWESRLGGCGLSLACEQQARDLMRYYDFGERWDVQEFHSTIDWNSVALDIIGIPLGFVGLGGKIPNNSRTVLQLLGVADSGYSLFNASKKEDITAEILAGGSAFPMVGGFFSAMSLGYDLGAGYWTTSPYIPPLPK
jgi:hypothetical protein